MQHIYIFAQSLTFNCSITLRLLSNYLIITIIEKEKCEEKENGVYLWPCRYKNSRFGEYEQFAPINGNLKACLKLGNN